MDLELSFITEEEILGLMEELLTDTLSKTTSHLKIASAPFPRIPYKEAMEKVLCRVLMHIYIIITTLS